MFSFLFNFTRKILKGVGGVFSFSQYTVDGDVTPSLILDFTGNIYASDTSAWIGLFEADDTLPSLILDFTRTNYASDEAAWALVYAADNRPPVLVLDFATTTYGKI